MQIFIIYFLFQVSCYIWDIYSYFSVGITSIRGEILFRGERWRKDGEAHALCFVDLVFSSCGAKLFAFPGTDNEPTDLDLNGNGTDGGNFFSVNVSPVF